MPLRGGWGGVGRLMANAILNFHFDYWHTSLIMILCIWSRCGGSGAVLGWTLEGGEAGLTPRRFEFEFDFDDSFDIIIPIMMLVQCLGRGYQEFSIWMTTWSLSLQRICLLLIPQFRPHPSDRYTF